MMLSVSILVLSFTVQAAAAELPATQCRRTQQDGSSCANTPFTDQGVSMLQLSRRTEVAKAATTTAAPSATTTAPTGDTTAPTSSGNVTEPVSNSTTPAVNGSDSAANTTGLCATRKDPRINAWFAQQSPEGTPCVFGVDGDPRDEGSHCVYDMGQYGSNGWCYTSKDRSSWGSCNEHCPLYGSTAKLGNKIDQVANAVGAIAGKLGVASGSKAAVEDAAANDKDSKASSKKESESSEAPKGNAKDAAANGKDSKAPSKEDGKASAALIGGDGGMSMIQISRRTGLAAAPAAAKPKDAAGEKGSQDASAAKGAGADDTGKNAPSDASAKDAGNATTPAPNTTASGNATEPSPAGNSAVCATRRDPRITAWFAAASPDGTPCVFGVDGDPRDEGSHCVFDNGEYGSNGWCYTSKDRSSWGSCNEHCPMYGTPAKLGSKIEQVASVVGAIAGKLGVSTDSKVSSTASSGAAASSKDDAASASNAASKDSKSQGSKDASKNDADSKAAPNKDAKAAVVLLEENGDQGVAMIQISQRHLGLAAAPASAKPTDAAGKKDPSAAKGASSNDAGNNAAGNASSKEAGNTTAQAPNATVPATDNATEPSSAKVCATRRDPRINAWFAAASPDGTPCVFGVDGDPRDEGSHCVFDNGEYGSNGWCYTSKDRSSWGSCNEHCPLYGTPAKLGSKIEEVASVVGAIADKMGVSSADAEGDTTTKAPGKESASNAASKDSESKAKGSKDAPKNDADSKAAPKNDAKASAALLSGDRVIAMGQMTSRTGLAAAPAAGPKDASAKKGSAEGAAPTSDAGKDAPSNASSTETQNITKPATDASVSAAGNATEPSSAGNTTLCAVRKDPRINAWFASASADGTPCVFGVEGDPRDEGSHCVFDNGEYGSNGWCYTSKDRSSWGSCNEHCPLYGTPAKLGNKIEQVASVVGAIAGKLGVSTDAPTGNSTAATSSEGDAATKASDAPPAAKDAPPSEATPAKPAKPAGNSGSK